MYFTSFPFFFFSFEGQVRYPGGSVKVLIVDYTCTLNMFIPIALGYERSMEF